MKPMLRVHTEQSLGIGPHQQVELWPLPDRLQVISFNAGAAATYGPVMWDLRVDWWLPGNTPWTSRCAEMLSDMFISRYWLGDYPNLEKGLTLDVVITMISTCILRLKGRYYIEGKASDGLAKQLM